jgi:hypothetical protein
MTPPHFYIFLIISPLKRTWPFIWTDLNSFHPRIICTKFDWIWPAGSEEDFKKKFSVFLLFPYYLPLEKGYPPPLNKLESPSPKDDLCQVWLKLVRRFWRRSRKCKSLQTDGQTDAGQRAIRKAVELKTCYFYRIFAKFCICEERWHPTPGSTN